MKSYSLHIGLNYPNTNQSLNGCWNDAKMMRSLAKRMGYQPTLCIDTKPTINRRFIVQHIKKLLARPSKSKLFLTFSGHGASVKTTQDKYEKDNRNEALVLSDSLLYDHELFALIRKYLRKKSTLFILLDCCHSGTGCDFPFILNQAKKTWIKDRPDTIINNKKPVTMISGCKDSQYSYEREQQGKIQGALTVAFYKALSSRRLRRRNRRTTHSLYSIIKQVTRLINDKSQRPQLSVSRWVKLNKLRI